MRVVVHVGAPSPPKPTATTPVYHHQVPTRLACLHWLAMLVEKAPQALAPLIEPVLLPALLRALADQADEVVLMDLQVGRCPFPSFHRETHALLQRLRLLTLPFPPHAHTQVLTRISVLGDAHFRRVLHAVLHLFQTDR